MNIPIGRIVLHSQTRTPFIAHMSLSRVFTGEESVYEDRATTEYTDRCRAEGHFRKS